MMQNHRKINYRKKIKNAGRRERKVTKKMMKRKSS